MTFQPQPIRVRGVDYPSQLAAARALGLHHGTVHEALERGTVDGLGLRRRKPVTLDGVTYASHREAARVLGVSVSTIHRRVKRAAPATREGDRDAD